MSNFSSTAIPDSATSKQYFSGLRRNWQKLDQFVFSEANKKLLKQHDSAKTMDCFDEGFNSIYVFQIYLNNATGGGGTLPHLATLLPPRSRCWHTGSRLLGELSEWRLGYPDPPFPKRFQPHSPPRKQRSNACVSWFCQSPKAACLAVQCGEKGGNRPYSMAQLLREKATLKAALLPWSPHGSCGPRRSGASAWKGCCWIKGSGCWAHYSLACWLGGASPRKMGDTIFPFLLPKLVSEYINWRHRHLA